MFLHHLSKQEGGRKDAWDQIKISRCLEPDPEKNSCNQFPFLHFRINGSMQWNQQEQLGDLMSMGERERGGRKELQWSDRVKRGQKRRSSWQGVGPCTAPLSLWCSFSLFSTGWSFHCATHCSTFVHPKPYYTGIYVFSFVANNLWLIDAR
jgi:hypothetical protein